MNENRRLTFQAIIDFGSLQISKMKTRVGSEDDFFPVAVAVVPSWLFGYF